MEICIPHVFIREIQHTFLIMKWSKQKGKDQRGRAQNSISSFLLKSIISGDMNKQLFTHFCILKHGVNNGQIAPAKLQLL